jgi:CheY-like chemotaxis protein
LAIDIFFYILTHYGDRADYVTCGQRVRNSLSVILEDDYKVVGLACGKEALEVVKRQQVDLVFLDVHMPGFRGSNAMHLNHLIKFPPNL